MSSQLHDNDNDIGRKSPRSTILSSSESMIMMMSSTSSPTQSTKESTMATNTTMDHTMTEMLMGEMILDDDDDNEQFLDDDIFDDSLSGDDVTNHAGHGVESPVVPLSSSSIGYNEGKYSSMASVDKDKTDDGINLRRFKRRNTFNDGPPRSPSLSSSKSSISSTTASTVSSSGSTIGSIGANTLTHSPFSTTASSTTRLGWMARSRSLVTDMQHDDDDSDGGEEGTGDYKHGMNNNSSDATSNRDLDEVDGRMMPGLLSKETPYTVKKVILQGYIHKKGSGFDWLGSRSWKPRWAALVMARVDGHHVDLPLLQIYWHSTSPTPSTVITLDSAVVVPERLTVPSSSSSSSSSPPSELSGEKPHHHHQYRFRIRHIKKSVNSDTTFQLTRVFSCQDEEGRDEWLSAISRTLLEFEKEKANDRRRRVLSSSPPPRRRRSGPALSLTATGDIAPNALFVQRHRRNMSTGTAPSVGIY